MQRLQGISRNQPPLYIYMGIDLLTTKAY